jgi:hypothetical protein
MPTLTGRVAATTDNALATDPFNTIPEGGAIANMWISGVTGTDTFGFRVGNEVFITDGAAINIEISADVVDDSRDQVLFNEELPPGLMSLPITLTTEVNYKIHLRYL